MDTSGSGTGRRRPSAEGTPGLRATVERRSATLLVFLYRLPRWTFLVCVFALLAVGMVGTGWLGAAALLVLAAFLAWFGYLNWPALDRSGRALRLGGVGVLVAFAVAQAFNSF
jgi:hypothetical protein